MHNGLSIFQYDENRVRVIERDGNPWFMAADVVAVLGVDLTQIRRLDADEKGLHTIQTPGGIQQVSIINESGLYSLTLTSRKESAKRFKKWVTSEVIPTIRKTGSYSMQPQELIARAVIEAQKLIEHQTAIIAEMQPKADFFDTVTGSSDAVDIGTVAKALNCGIGRTRLFSFLRDCNILQSNNQPYQRYIDAGYFRVIESTFNKPDGSTHVTFKTVVYQKGVDYIRKRIAAANKTGELNEAA